MDVVAVVIDNGSGSIKAGFCGEDAPRTVFSSMLGKPRIPGIVCGGPYKDCYIGPDAQAKRGILSLRFPIQRGVVQDWDDMEKLWHYTFYQALKITPDDHPMLFTEAPLNPLRNKERMVSILFETFEVPALYVSIQAVLSLYAGGLTTGVVVDAGDGVTHIVPVYEGYAIRNAIYRIDLAGRDITEYLQLILREKGFALLTPSEMEIVREMKEKMCFVAEDYEHSLKTCDSNIRTQYELPDGQVVPLSEERFQCPEALFRPQLLGREALGLHESTYASIFKCDLDIRRHLMANVVLSGGSSLFPGLPERLQREVSSLVPSASRVRVHAPPERKFSVWIGGSILASVGTYSEAQMWITRDEYDEHGPRIVHRKCL